MDKLDQQLQHSIRGEFDLGWKLVQELEQERPNCNRCAFNRGWYVLRFGNLYKGMELLSRGRWEKVFGNPPINSNKPIFNIKTDNIKNKSVLLNLEGGFGDEIIGFRYTKTIKQLGGRCIIACHPKLMDLFSSQKNISAVVSSNSAGLKFTYHDYWVPAMSAEQVFGYDYETLPNKSYLEAKPEYINKFKDIINSNKFKIGIRYVGNPEFEHEQHRLFPEKLMFDLFTNNKIKNKIQVYSLQKDLGVNKKLPKNVIDLEDKLQTWDDTAGAISNLDLVISSCTSVAHLSAAMGKLTYIIVPILSYYIWAYELQKDFISNGQFTSYYEAARVFRQTKYGDWEEPFNNIKKGLENLKFRRT
jgi:hypothetical protein